MVSITYLRLTYLCDRCKIAQLDKRRPKQLSSAKEFLLLRILPLIFVVVGAAIAFFGIRDIVRAKGSVDWPAVHGKIVSSSVEHLRTRTGTSGK